MSNEIEKTNISFAFGFAMFLICIGLFSYFLNDNNIIKIIAVAFFTFGFMGLGFELQNLGVRAQYFLVSGLPFLPALSVTCCWMACWGNMPSVMWWLLS